MQTLDIPFKDMSGQSQEADQSQGAITRQLATDDQITSQNEVAVSVLTCHNRSRFAVMSLRHRQSLSRMRLTLLRRRQRITLFESLSGIPPAPEASPPAAAPAPFFAEQTPSCHPTVLTRFGALFRPRPVEATNLSKKPCLNRYSQW